MRQIRESEFKDYVAVDVVDDKGKILSTPIYLQKGRPVKLLARDTEDQKYLTATVIFDGEKLICDGIDMEWEAPISELNEKDDNGYQLFKPLTP